MGEKQTTTKENGVPQAQEAVLIHLLLAFYFIILFSRFVHDTIPVFSLLHPSTKHCFSKKKKGAREGGLPKMNEEPQFSISNKES